ncbi:hypothetical protein LTR84_004347 [Exophiala bonariae]|uniref:Translin-associated protein X n=1 Tax=Exophiala bonariae TaxID=1690606 RepID=A0AAV9N5N2_9EURO|nr:hypothetical protein LTR84_004347 [Exophiala bonariae]
MPGTKRDHNGMEVVSKSTEEGSPFIPIFESFRTELDEHHDRRERIIKASRDITAQSKKIIFALQRVRELGRPIHASITNQIKPMYSTINDLFTGIIPDLQGINAYRYRSNITGGTQEFMEALLFQHYLETQHLLDYEGAAKRLPEGILLTYEDYVLGVFDMTGELMRFAITYMATNGRLPGSSGSGSADSSILTDMQQLRMELEGLDTGGSYALNKEFAQKLKTTRQSTEKIESGVYSMIVRGKERPKGWRPDVSLSDGPRDSEATEAY